MSSPALLIRPSLLSDLGAIVEIDAHAVAHGTSSFELDVPDGGGLAYCETAGARLLLVVNGDSANHGSIGVHRVLGFERCGLLECVGSKFGRWLDVVQMQRPPGRGAHNAPAGGVA